MISVLKIGGAIVEDQAELLRCLEQIHRMDGQKILIHGGGRSASELLLKLGIEPNMINGRRVTDEQTLEFVTYTYSGLNKQIVSKFSALGSSAIGLCGPDAQILIAKKRSPIPIDYGFVGDITVEGVNSNFLMQCIEHELIPVLAPLTDDGKGNLLNTNADTIASVVAQAVQSHATTRLIYVFEQIGLLEDVSDSDSLIPKISYEEYQSRKESGSIHSGMIPKLDNAFAAKQNGVEQVYICSIDHLLKLDKKTELL